MPKKVITGNHSASYGAKSARAEVVSAYPITPQTQIVEKIAELIASGEMKAQYLKVESEHSAMASCITASAVGARTFTATSSQGLLLMHELLHWASGARLPIVMGSVNRAVAPPWTVWTDQQDTISQRDTGWMQFYCENNQEVYDAVILGYKIAENEEISLPFMFVLDAFVLSHTAEPVEIIEQEKVDKFLPPFNPKVKLDVENPLTFWGLVRPDGYYELRYKIAKAMEDAKKIIKEVGKDFGKNFGRDYSQLVVPYKTDDAEIILIVSGTIASTSKDAIDKLRKNGIKVGLGRVRVFRPFPKEELIEICKNANVIGVLDRNFSFGNEGAFFMETKSAFYSNKEKPIIKNYVLGLGGRDITVEDIENIVNDLINVKKEGLKNEIEWYGLNL